MTVKELKQYRSIRAEIEELQVRIKDSTIRGAVKGSDSEFPFTQHMMSVQGMTSTKDNLRLLARIDRLTKQKKRIEDFVENIDDSLTRRIFEYRYIRYNKMPSWQAIAFKVGGYDESNPRRKHNRFCKEMGVL